jgi:Tol biopolymer transport system component
MVLACVLCVFGACGSVVADQMPDAGTDATTDDAGQLGMARCRPDAPFGAAQPIDELNTGDSQENAYLSPDELTLYFSSMRSGSLGEYDLFVASRPTRDDRWRAIVPVDGVNTTGTERNPVISSDGLTLYAVIDKEPNYNVGVATRTRVAGRFTALAPVTELDSTSDDQASTLLPDGSAMWMSSKRSGGGDLYRASRSGGRFGSVDVVVGTHLNDPAAADQAAVVTTDELTLFFTSTRAGGAGSYDIWMAHRRRVSDGFDDPVNLQIVNTPALDVPSWISADGCVLYLTSGPVNGYNLYVATRGH